MREEKKRELQSTRARVAEIKDALGEPIDEGIKEAVAMFNAMGLRTTQSCEGHPEKPGLKGEGPSLAPWIDVGPEEPDKPNWTEDEGLREKIYRETRGYKRKMIGLLGEFYDGRKASYDVILACGAGYWFRVESRGAEFLEDLHGTERLGKYQLYKKEMDDFAEFLREKYLAE